MARRLIGTLPQNNQQNGYTFSGVPDSQPLSPTPKTSSGGGLDALINALPVIGGVVGGVAGSVVPGLGTTVGAGAGGFAGEAVKQRIKSKKGALGVLTGKDVEGDFGKAAKEGVVSGVGSAIGLGAEKLGGAVLRGAGKKIAEAGAATVAKIKPEAWEKAAELGINVNSLVKKWLPKLGGNFDEALGVVGRGEKAGTLSTRLAQEEAKIQSTAKAAKGIRLFPTDIIKGLKSEAKEIGRELGGEKRAMAMTKIVQDATQRYKNGISLETALSKLRTANSKFGASILDDTADAVATAAQKLEANTLRNVIKSRFPDIADALDTQQELIILREILKKARAKEAVKGIKLGKFDITRPGSFIDPILESPRVFSAATQMGEKGYGALGALGNIPGISSILGQAGAQEADKLFLEGKTTEQRPVSTTAPTDTTTTQQTPATGGIKITPEMVQTARMLWGKEKGDLVEQLYKDQFLGQEREGKKTEAQIAREEAIELAQSALTDLSAGGITTGLLQGPAEELKAIFNAADQPTLDFNRKISMLKATIAKARAGTSFTPGEENLLNQYVPKIGDSDQLLNSKLNNFLIFMKKRKYEDKATK